MRHHRLVIATLALICCLLTAADQGAQPDGQAAEGTRKLLSAADPALSDLCVRLHAFLRDFLAQQGAGNCENAACLEGEFRPTAGVACAKCAAGTVADSRGATSCSQCAPGYHQPATGQTKCIAAPKGSYVSDRGASAVQHCPAGTFNDKEGQSSSAACTPCPAGQAQPLSGASSCSPCAAGQFAPAGSASCFCTSEFQFASGGTGACTECPDRALAKRDEPGCYRRVAFARCTASGQLLAEHACEKAIDSKPDIFISQMTGATWWTGHFPGPTSLRKVVLWRRPDCCPDQFIGISLKVVTAAGDRPCGSVTAADTLYKIFDCNVDAATAVTAHRDASYAKWISLAEVEAYTV